MGNARLALSLKAPDSGNFSDPVFKSALIDFPAAELTPIELRPPSRTGAHECTEIEDEPAALVPNASAVEMALDDDLGLGEILFRKAGRDFRYMMVFENNPIDGAERLSDALKKLGQL